MKIDAHQFFWKYQHGQFAGKSQEQFDVLKNDHFPHDLLVSMVNDGFEESIAVQHNDSDHETDFLLELANENDYVRGVVGWIDLGNPNIDQKISYYQDTRLVSFRESFVQKEDSYFAQRPDVIRGIELIGEHNMPIDIQCRPDQFPAVIDLVAQFPKQVFVFNDMGFVPRSPVELESWKRLVAILSEFENVNCKINGLFMMKKIVGMDQQQIAECLLFVLERFGAERLIFGSDWPYSKMAFDYHAQIQWLEQVLESCTQDEMDLIFGRTAENVYYFY